MHSCPYCNAEIKQKTARCPECGNTISSKKTKAVIAVLLILVVAGALFVVLERPQYLENTPLHGYAIAIQENTFAFTEAAKNFVFNTVANHPNMQKTIDYTKEQIEKVSQSPPKLEKSIESIQNSESSAVTAQKTQELVQHALDKINKDRQKNNLQPVQLSSNSAAQLHADDVFETQTISHWMSNGEKPYMTYTKSGGVGAVTQNVGTASCSGFGCALDPIEKIDELDDSMMYDDEASNWGHRDNILRPYHTHVSIGIAYDDNFFVLVQNFEDHYLISENPIRISGNNIQINSELKSGKIPNIGIFYDSLPTADLYELHKDDKAYEMGDSIAVVAPPAPLGSFYEKPDDYKIIEAKRWTVADNSVLIDFDLTPALDKPGVYIIGVFLEDGTQEFMATNYSVFWK